MEMCQKDMELCQKTYIFKILIEKFCQKLSPQFKNSWIEQIHNIHIFWDEMIDKINKDDFKNQFSSFCRVYNMTTDIFPIQFCMNWAKNRWKLQLMIKTANRIAHEHICGAPKGYEIVKWTGSIVIVDWTSFKHRF